MPTDERIITMLTVVLCVLALCFGLAAIFVPEFRENGGTIVGVIGGLLGAPVTAYIAARFTREFRNGGTSAPDRQRPEEEPGGGEG